jgi:Beta-ketoacyl synthase, N-terminal domain
MSELTAYVDGISVVGPGFADWPAAEAVLAGRAAYVASPTVLPAPAALPAAERRRTGRIVKLAMAAGLEAAGRSGLDAATLVTVFSSSGGDGDNCHEICQTLATSERQLSPTRFHNSVHNASAGYWSIATRAMAASTALCAHDASFAAGLLEALAQVVVARRPVLLIACDTGYPPPLYQKRPIADAFGMALVLAPDLSPRSVARLSAAIGDGIVDRLDQPPLEELRLAAPAGRCLPLLALLARQRRGSVALEYLDATSVRTAVEPC